VRSGAAPRRGESSTWTSTTSLGMGAKERVIINYK
jgi:hypothetical protein